MKQHQMKKASIENSKYWDYTNDSLKYIIKDAKEAVKLMPDCRKTGVWLDQINDACTVLYYRQQMLTLCNTVK